MATFRRKIFVLLDAPDNEVVPIYVAEGQPPRRQCCDSPQLEFDDSPNTTKNGRAALCLCGALWVKAYLPLLKAAQKTDEDLKAIYIKRMEDKVRELETTLMTYNLNYQRTLE